MPSLHVKEIRSPDRFKVTVPDFAETVGEFKTKVADCLGIPVDQQRMVYWGQIMENDRPLQSYNLRNNITIYVVRMHKEDANAMEEKSMDEISSGKLSSILETAIKNPLYKHSVRKILQDSEALEQIVAAAPGLKDDHVAMTLLKDPELLLQVSDTANVEGIVQDHPALAQAASHIIAAITEDTTATRQLLQDRRNIGSDSDDELQEFDPELIAQAELMAGGDEQHQETQGEGSGNDSRITQANLSAALAQAGVFRSSPSTSHDPGPSRSRQNIITSEFFSQALSSALSSTVSTASDTSNPEQSSSGSRSSLNAEALQQMRDMGITDDELSARALQVSGGDVQTALNLIFEGGLD